MKKYELITDKLTIEHITKAMLFHNREPFATSNQIARYFGVRHDNLLSKIRSFHSFDKLVKSLKIKELKRTYRGQKYPYFELDGDAFVFTCMSITGKNAESFKWAFIAAYKKATTEALTARITAEANSANKVWLEARTQGKMAHGNYTDAIKTFCLYAEEQRGKPYGIDKDGYPVKKPCPYYIHFQRVAYQKSGVEVNKGHLPKRDSLSGAELERVEDAEYAIAEMVVKMMNAGYAYKKIFKIARDNVGDTSDELYRISSDEVGNCL